MVDACVKKEKVSMAKVRSGPLANAVQGAGKRTGGHPAALRLLDGLQVNHGQGYGAIDGHFVGEVELPWDRVGSQALGVIVPLTPRSTLEAAKAQALPASNMAPKWVLKVLFMVKLLMWNKQRRDDQ
jgi:hypothetical protein